MDSVPKSGIKHSMRTCLLHPCFRLPFRKLVRKYGADVAYTPMIYASNFVASEKCRRSEFTTEPGENPIVQFAAKLPEDFAAAAELVHG
jgi:tRNA-dihydrouridine synthase 4